jgi:hypothetical protein
MNGMFVAMRQFQKKSVNAPYCGKATKQITHLKAL